MTNGKQVPLDGNRMLSDLTIREYFAAMALQGMLANAAFTERAYELDLQPAMSGTAVKLADALIAALNQEASKDATA